MDELTKRRLERNEAVFKSINEEIDGRTDDDRELEYVCECADPKCTDTIRMTHGDYKAVRSEPNWYFIIEGHERLEVERVVERHPAYIVVEKF